MPRILVVDDQRNMRTTLAMMLRGASYDVEEAADGDAACERISQETFDLVLTDLRMGGRDGMDVLRAVKDRSPQTEVIVMTAYGTIESAVEAMRAGAFDYVQKPFREQELLVKVQKALEARRLTGELTVMASEFRERYRFENIIGRSAAIREVLGRIVRIAPTDATVLITGESGTGKELVARAIHANSHRAGRPFVPVNCAAVSETLFESELFGHVRGAFTGAVSSRKGLLEEASGGTFFFDEIAETPPSFQAKLLRALQDGEIRRLGDNKPVHVDIRVVAATNQDLRQAIAERRFREDLYYRLNVVRFVLPPLRERREDIPLLVEHFLERYGRKMRRKVRLGEGALEYLMGLDYPGNVRELENLIEQAVALADSGVIGVEDLVTPDTPRATSPAGVRRPDGTVKPLQDVIDEAEKAWIEKVLREVDGNKERAAEALGLSGTTLWRKMKRLNVTGP
ncbi:MAG: sigma-54 dependent transcriptional regulator [Myxococcota bacterium]|nr:sigma-54 dependent transcriptional regulator [Myxococcota bacterium]MDW8363328.1 sigma-54 dependent transcriptional regulator [Myxococcales bacterium]